MKGALTKRIVKIKKIQKVGENHMIILPKAWIDEMDWNRNTRLILEFLPYRKIIIISTPRGENEEVSDIIKVPD